MDIRIETYSPAQSHEMIALWNAALGAEFPMTGRLWRQNVDADPNYAAGDGLIARNRDGAAVGLALTRTFRHWREVPDMAALRNLGWILALIIAPQEQGKGLGAHLLALAEEWLRAGSATRCDLGGGLGHFLPGPPTHDTRALTFWERHGYLRGDEAHDLRRQLAEFTPPAEPDALRTGAFHITPGREGEQDEILGFLSQAFPGRWRYAVETTFARGGAAEDVLLLKDRTGRIKGFLSMWHFRSALLGPSVYWYPALGERFGGIGPLGIAQDVRGLGLGLSLVSAGVSALRASGVEECGIDWTRLAPFYERLGFRVWRSYWRCQQKRLA